MPNMKLSFGVVRSIALNLPGVEEKSIHGAPSLKVNGKLLACPALHTSAEPNSIVVRISPDERAQLISSQPNAYYLTDHYADYPMVLVRLSELDRKSVQELLEKSWQFASTKPKKTARKPPGPSEKKVPL